MPKTAKTAKKVKAAKTAKVAKAAKTAATNSRAAMAARSITVVAKENPRREKTDAHKYFKAMQGSATVGAYLKRFADDQKARRDASLWLSASVRDGHVKLGKPQAAAA
jgi:hypothetical protein